MKKLWVFFIGLTFFVGLTFGLFGCAQWHPWDDSKAEPFKLKLPKDVPDSVSGNISTRAQLVILLSGHNDIYAYRGSDIRKGKKYTYQEITNMLKDRKTDTAFVVIRPAQSSTYHNIVDMLDVMTIAGIKHYALVDITKNEEAYLHEIY